MIAAADRLRRLRTLAVLVSVSVGAWLAVGTTPVPRPTRDGTSEAEAGVEDQFRRAGPLSLLMDNFGLDSTTAGTQLVRQEWAQRRIQVEGLGALPGWAGVWIDHAGDGTVYFSASDPETVADLGARPYPDWVRIRQVEHSLAVLDDLRRDVRSHIVDDDRTTVELSLQFDRLIVSFDLGSADEARMIERYQGDPRVVLQVS